ncbi:cytochrome c oxidase subunit II [Neptunitalea lumnitzerae]|uniref:Cytochrome c oxidase subunit II n=1 Tax=Neptunitalea lumnitzerae TaxID=2965509 RepID=A0ABQ5MNA3_9FLAO|nr:cytochrome c oxidase subunit II [Neptunitalea sp. Y10]GLB50457.1 cytochrome c oxidase subunit II [Neptunitalea sp. Y10]
MNKYEIRVIVLSSTILGVFFFALLFNVFSRKIDVPTCIPYNASFQKSEVRKVDEDYYEVYVTARMWNFDPGEIIVPRGSTVDFYLTSADVVHGFNIERKGVNLMAVPGAVNKTTVKFDEYGEYRIVCHEYCGVGHQNMMGRVLVTNSAL